MIVRSAKDWKWSSHGETESKKRALTDESPIDLPGEWGRYVDGPFTGDELEKLRQSVNRQAPYGESNWQMLMCKTHGLESTLRGRGRPRKGEIR